MEIEQRLKGFAKLGKFLQKIINSYGEDIESDEVLLPVIQSEQYNNPWFTPDNIIHSLKGITHLLDYEGLEQWINSYKISLKNKNVGVIMAGNIPLVGFHDFLCVVLSGNRCICKLSSKDQNLFTKITDILISIDPDFKETFEIRDSQLTDIDAVVATGSNNTSRYFEYYFGKYPHIIRKNRNSIAILDGNETEEDFQKLSNDIFLYFGLGCRNVSKLMVPEGFNFNTFFEGIEHQSTQMQHHKYMNNHDYYRSVYLLNQVDHLDNGFLIVKKDEGISSPLGVLFYQTYKKKEDISAYIEKNKDQLQCIVSNDNQYSFKTVPLGKSQLPEINDYADNVDTMEFLISL